MIKDPKQDHKRMTAYPNLEYGNLYNALAMLLDVAPNIQVGLNGRLRVPQTKISHFRIFIELHLFFANSFWESGTSLFGVHSALSGQRSNRKYPVFGGIINFSPSTSSASRNYQLSMLFYFAIYHYTSEH